MVISEERKSKAIQAANDFYELVDRDTYARMSPGEIDEALSKLAVVRTFFNSYFVEIELAKTYLEKMKRARADKDDLGSALKYVAYGIRMAADLL